MAGLLSLLKETDAPWEVARNSIYRDLEQIELIINKRWSKTFASSNILGIPSGGTGLASLTAHALYVGNGTSVPTALAVGATNTLLHGNTGANPSFSAVVEADITLSNNTTNNVTTGHHGFTPILPNDATKFLDGTGAFSTPVTAATGMPIVGGTSPATTGRRVTWLQKGDSVNSSAMIAVGMAAATITGGSGIFDTAGFWARATSTAGNSARFSAASAFTMVDLLPKAVFRVRTNSSITSTRILVSLNESFAGVDTDTPSLTTQRGIYVRYSTAVPDGGWVVQTVNGSGRSTSATVLAIAASTVYVITITVVDTGHVKVDINGTAITVTSNIITGVKLGYEINVRDLAAATQQIDCESIYVESN